MLDPSESVSLHCLKEKQKKLFCRDRSAVSWRSSRGQPSAESWGLGSAGEWGGFPGQKAQGFFHLEKVHWEKGHREQTYGHGESGGEGEMCGKSNMETYITICKIDSQQEFVEWLRKLKQGLWINLEGWDGEGDGREVQKGGDVCTPMVDSC